MSWEALILMTEPLLIMGDEFLRQKKEVYVWSWTFRDKNIKLTLISASLCSCSALPLQRETVRLIESVRERDRICAAALPCYQS